MMVVAQKTKMVKSRIKKDGINDWLMILVTEVKLIEIAINVKNGAEMSMANAMNMNAIMDMIAIAIMNMNAIAIKRTAF